MRWSDERYVRVYTRDTGEWLALGWEAQALFLFLLRKADRAGLLKTGKLYARALAGLAAMPLDVVARSLPLLLEDGCLRQVEGGFVIPNYIAAQETRSTDRQRKADQRERDVDMVMASGFAGSKEAAKTLAQMSRAVTSQTTPVTNRDHDADSGHAVRSPDLDSRDPVTPTSHPMPYRAVPSHTVETTVSTSVDPQPPRESPNDLRALWNTEADPRLPRWRDLTGKRATQATTRLVERPLAEWRLILGRINASPFCLGQNDRGWKADVEFFLRPDTATKVLEGKYDAKGGGAPAAPRPSDDGWEAA